MKQLLQLNKTVTQFGTVTLVFISRLGLLPANISPLGSYGFFGNPLLYVIAILTFDLLVKGIYPGVVFTYIGFLFYPILGKLSTQSVKKQLILLPLASFLFFVFSNLGVWWYWYEHTLTELLMCYTLALPFYTRTFLSDIFFGYSYLFLQKYSGTISSDTLLMKGRQYAR